MKRDKELDRYTAKDKEKIIEIDQILKKKAPKRNFIEEIKYTVLEFQASQNESLRSPAE